jgi:hypothetical protein
LLREAARVVLYLPRRLAAQALQAVRCPVPVAHRAVDPVLVAAEERAAARTQTASRAVNRNLSPVMKKILHRQVKILRKLTSGILRPCLSHHRKIRYRYQPGFTFRRHLWCVPRMTFPAILENVTRRVTHATVIRRPKLLVKRPLFLNRAAWSCC